MNKRSNNPIKRKTTSTGTVAVVYCNVNRSDLHTHMALQTAAEKQIHILFIAELRIFSIQGVLEIVKHLNYNIAIRPDHNRKVTAYVNSKHAKFKSKYLDRHICQISIGLTEAYGIDFPPTTLPLDMETYLHRIKLKFRSIVIGYFHVHHQAWNINNNHNARG